VAWRRLFSVGILVSVLASLSQLVLILGWNRAAGIPDIVFALGDDVVVATVGFVLSMPMLVLMARICPAGVESSVYALVTSLQVTFSVNAPCSSTCSRLTPDSLPLSLLDCLLQMVGQTVSGTLSAQLTAAFGAGAGGDYGALARLCTCTALLRLLALPFVLLVPTRPGRVSHDLQERGREVDGDASFFGEGKGGKGVAVGGGGKGDGRGGGGGGGALSGTLYAEMSDGDSEDDVLDEDGYLRPGARPASGLSFDGVMAASAAAAAAAADASVGGGGFGGDGGGRGRARGRRRRGGSLQLGARRTLRSYCEPCRGGGGVLMMTLLVGGTLYSIVQAGLKLAQV
jgi:hypothetical protein